MERKYSIVGPSKNKNFFQRRCEERPNLRNPLKYSHEITEGMKNSKHKASEQTESHVYLYDETVESKVFLTSKSFLIKKLGI